MRRARLYIKKEQHGVGKGDIYKNEEKITQRREGTYMRRVYKKIRI